MQKIISLFALIVLTLTTHAQSDNIYLNNLWKDGSNYYALMTGSNFSIPPQQVS